MTAKAKVYRGEYPPVIWALSLLETASLQLYMTRLSGSDRLLGLIHLALADPDLIKINSFIPSQRERKGPMLRCQCLSIWAGEKRENSGLCQEITQMAIGRNIDLHPN